MDAKKNRKHALDQPASNGKAKATKSNKVDPAGTNGNGHVSTVDKQPGTNGSAVSLVQFSVGPRNGSPERRIEVNYPGGRYDDKLDTGDDVARGEFLSGALSRANLPATEFPNLERGLQQAVEKADALTMTLTSHFAEQAEQAKRELDEALAYVRGLPEQAAADPGDFLLKLLDGDTIAKIAHVADVDQSAFERLCAQLRKANLRVKDIESLRRAVKAELPKRRRSADGIAGHSCYRTESSGLIWERPTADGTVDTLLTNFTAKILQDVVHDDGTELLHHFEIEAEIAKKPTKFSVPAAKFAAMNWPLEHLGAEAVVMPGSSVKDHARAAIQLLSTPQKRTVYTHTGWRKVDGIPCYLHAEGAIGPNGPIPGIEVGLSGVLSRYVLPNPPDIEELRRCVKETLRLRQLAPLRITCCLEGAVFRAPLGGACDSTVFLTGETGNGKSELVALSQQHYGAGMDRKNLPATWASTGNALEGVAHAAKDAMLVVDDYCPRGTPHDVARYAQTADRLIRAQRNQAGRQRMHADGSQRAVKVPRGVIVATGEDTPPGHSLRASMMVLDHEKSEFDWDLLTEKQKLGREGVFAKTMAGYVQCLAQNYDQVQGELADRLVKFRGFASESMVHRRTPELVANLFLGTWYFLRFAREIDAISEDEHAVLRDEAWAAVGEAAANQEEHLQAADPARRFFELLTSALASGQAHLAADDGDRPFLTCADGHPTDIAKACGWRLEDSRDVTVWKPQGDRIGWVDRDGNVYLDQNAAFKAVQEMGRHSEGLPIGPKTLSRRLREGKFLASTGKSRGKNTVQRTLGGTRREVLHLKGNVIGINRLNRPTEAAKEV